MKNHLDIALLAVIGMLGAAQPAVGQTAVVNKALPAIDTVAPNALETATFALG
jgi:hypothetical protein